MKGNWYEKSIPAHLIWTTVCESFGFRLLLFKSTSNQSIDRSIIFPTILLLQGPVIIPSTTIKTSTSNHYLITDIKLLSCNMQGELVTYRMSVPIQTWAHPSSSLPVWTSCCCRWWRDDETLCVTVFWRMSLTTGRLYIAERASTSLSTQAGHC